MSELIELGGKIYSQQEIDKMVSELMESDDPESREKGFELLSLANNKRYEQQQEDENEALTEILGDLVQSEEWMQQTAAELGVRHDTEHELSDVMAVIKRKKKAETTKKRKERMQKWLRSASNKRRRRN